MRSTDKNGRRVDPLEGLIERVLERPFDRLPLDSSRSYREPKDPLAGICLVLDIRQLQRPAGQAHRVSVLEAPLAFAGTDLVAVRMTDQLGIRAYGEWSAGLDQVIPVVKSKAYGRGTREWLACRCGQKAMKLYLPPGADSFACASCHSLRRGRGRALRYSDQNLQPWLLHWALPDIGEWLKTRVAG